MSIALLASWWGAGFAQNIELQPFEIDHQARKDSAADVRFLLDAPAGKSGFIGSSGGHLVTPSGERFRIWGVNVTGFTKGSALLMPKAEAATWAAEFARLGVNCVRLHFLDRTTLQIPVGLIDGTRNDTRVLDPEHLDRLDYFIYQLKQHGVYTDLNLNVGRTYKEGDGVDGYRLIGPAKGMTYFVPRLLELQREYAKELLCHYNPYTHSEYRNEPAIAIVELVNENSILEFWERNWLRGKLTPDAPRYQLDLTPAYERLLTDDYNRWLNHELKPEALAKLRIEAGVGPGQPIPRLRREQFSDAPKDRFYLEAAFYTQMEGHFLTGMRRYLKEDLGVKSLIIGTADHTYWIPGLPLLRSTSQMDIVDAHVYWQHPAIYGIRNTPMVNAPLASIEVKLTRSTFAGKPFTVSEVNHPYPNEYESEMIPILAAYAAFQDWDGIFWYTFEPKLEGKWQHFIADPFDISLDPVKIAQLPVGALIFLRHDVQSAKTVIERSYSKEQINESIRLPESERPYFTPGFPLSLPLRHGSRIRCLDCEPTAHFEDRESNPIVSDTKELSWYTSSDKGGLVTIDTDKTQALVGFVKANGIATRYLSADIKNDFCAITLSSLDSKPIPRAETLLLTAGARVQNSGAKWNERHTLFTEWGTAPVLIEPVTGWILLKELQGAVGLEAVPLDGAARPMPEIHGRRLEAGWEIAVGAPATTTYLLHIIR